MEPCRYFVAYKIVCKKLKVCTSHSVLLIFINFTFKPIMHVYAREYHAGLCCTLLLNLSYTLRFCLIVTI